MCQDHQMALNALDKDSEDNYTSKTAILQDFAQERFY